jgi:hypothetical protein
MNKTDEIQILPKYRVDLDCADISALWSDATRRALKAASCRRTPNGKAV